VSNLDFSWTERDDRAVMSGPGYQVTFMRTGGRWTHRLELDGIEVVVAVESDPERDDAARVVSPVYQEVQHHDFPNALGLCALLTGQLAQHHFSAAVRLFRDAEQPDHLVLDIDVADRCRATVERLAATYLVRLDSGTLVYGGPQMIVWNPGGPFPAQLALIAEPPSVLALAEAGWHATRVQALAAIQPGTFTHRLRYRWRWRTVPGNGQEVCYSRTPDTAPARSPRLSP
jgi:hypothetical protein